MDEQTSTKPKPHPEVEVQLSGEDGNAYAIIGAVAKGLRRAGHPEDATRWNTWAMQSESYDQLLRRAMRTVTVL